MVVPESDDIIIELDYSSSEQDDENSINGMDDNLGEKPDTSIDNTVSDGIQ